VNGAQLERLERRLLVLAPVGRDAALIRDILHRDAVACDLCRDLEELSREVERGAAAIVVAEEVLAEHEGRLAQIIAAQPPWSDLPVLVLTRQGADSPAARRAVQTLGNVTLLERPMRIGALSSAVRSALRARARQYQARAHLEERELASQRKDAFLATLAHELRNPLAPIRNALNILRLSAPGRATPSVHGIIERQVNQMVRLVEDLLEVSRITRGKIELRRQPVDLRSAIDVAVETSRPLIDAAGHRLSVSYPQDALVVDADPVRLAQVFANLLNNAARYTDPGGRIEIAVRDEDGAATVRVSDTGIGIDATELPTIFEMFSQAHARDARAQTGLGIGLTLARSLVEMHGGSIQAASEGPGRGSEFVVRLPVSAARSTTSIPAAEPASGIGHLRRVLVVDDNRDAADTLGAMLQMIGVDARVAYDGKAALEAVEGFRPAVVVLDLGMPGMDGYAVARAIRERAHLNDVRLVALTGWGQERDRALTRQAGFDHHLIKPVDIDAMQAVLERFG
jgi:signal transduction histidine kinase